MSLFYDLYCVFVCVDTHTYIETRYMILERRFTSNYIHHLNYYIFEN